MHRTSQTRVPPEHSTSRVKQTANGMSLSQRVVPCDGCTRFIDVERDTTIPKNLESLRTRLQCKLHAAAEHDYFASAIE